MGALLGLARESVFFSCFKDKINMRTPKVFYSHADFALGRKVAILEDLSHLKQAGVYFGPGNPNNWGKQLEANLEKQVCRASFKEAAKLHAAHWKNKDLLQFEWLRCAKWVKGLDQPSWLGS